ncbi:hypothetical protein TNCV_679991 [Trichonephila clavipes]|nr:hypothetical protein TNCV_679991 [Trichonephila clavipes]
MVVARCWQASGRTSYPLRRVGRVAHADDHRTHWRRTGQRSDPAFIVEPYSNFTRCVSVERLCGRRLLKPRQSSSLVVLDGTLMLEGRGVESISDVVGYDPLLPGHRDLSPIEHPSEVAGKSFDAAVLEIQRINQGASAAGSSAGYVLEAS